VKKKEISRWSKYAQPLYLFLRVISPVIWSIILVFIWYAVILQLLVMVVKPFFRSLLTGLSEYIQHQQWTNTAQ